MCGIAGWLGHVPEGRRVAERALRSLHHRGPDDKAVREWPEATLIHTRLSIIDLSRAGAQPMANEDRTVWVVFNGEIYNHRELRRDLQARGHNFKGHSDAEVLPHLYEEEGPDLVNKLRGMFALAIYDSRNKTLTLARDRFGIKPLFYAPGCERFVFASEIAVLREMPFAELTPDRQAIFDFAALFYIPAPETCYKEIRALQPGEILTARFDVPDIAWHVRRYHTWTITPDPSLTLNQAVDRAEELVIGAVNRQLESDVPLGALLSGGIDSSLVSRAAGNSLGEGVHTFNVRFGDNEYDETWAALAVAKHIGSHHVTLDMDEVHGTWEYITGLLRHAGQPFADTSLFAVNAVCKLMRKHVKVALSGDGGDEGFGGYDFYHQIPKIAYWQTLPAVICHSIAMSLLPLGRLGVVSATLPQRLSEFIGADDTTIIQNLFCWIREREHELLCRDADVLPVRRLFEPEWDHSLPADATRVERLSAHATEVNIRLTLPNDFLFKVDTASMRESLEIRVPMLDEDLFEFALSLPHHLKATGRMGKRVLRALADRWLPAEVARKPKWGFGIPVDQWVDSDFRTRLKETLLGSSSTLPDFFHEGTYRPWIEAFCEGNSCFGVSRQGLYQRVIMLLSVQLTMEQNFG